MRARSLKVRLLAVQALVIVLTLAITGITLTYLFERHIERGIGKDLTLYLDQLAARLDFDNNGKPRLGDPPVDPRFDKVYGGLYWQITNETTEQTVRSRSLWDNRLDVPLDTPKLGEIQRHTLPGPNKSILRVHERRVIVTVSGVDNVVRLAIAVDLKDLKHSRHEFAEEVTTALMILGGLLLLASWLQVTIGLRPLSRIRDSISHIRHGSKTRIEEEFPREVRPLVEEVNSLLSSQETAIVSAKNRAADLAHGFKTPLTALNADARRLRKHGELQIAAEIEQTSFLMQRQIDKELARTRMRDVRHLRAINVKKILIGIITTVQRTPEAERSTINIQCPADLQALIHADDLADILGNLIENAVKHAKSDVNITAVKTSSAILFWIEDDGEGIDADDRRTVLKRGVRLDQQKAGTGLGLAIVTDLLDAYGKQLLLETSTSGGLKVSFELPAALSEHP